MSRRQTLVEHLGGAHGGTWYSFKEPKSGKGRPVDLDAVTVARLKAHRAAQSATRLRLGLAWTDLDCSSQTRSASPYGHPQRRLSSGRWLSL